MSLGTLSLYLWVHGRDVILKLQEFCSQSSLQDDEGSQHALCHIRLFPSRVLDTVHKLTDVRVEFSRPSPFSRYCINTKIAGVQASFSCGLWQIWSVNAGAISAETQKQTEMTETPPTLLNILHAVVPTYPKRNFSVIFLLLSYELSASGKDIH